MKRAALILVYRIHSFSLWPPLPQHVVFSVRLLTWLVPDVPAALVAKVKREGYPA